MACRAPILGAGPPAGTGGRLALFLDRDGVVNVERNYVHRSEDFEFIEGIFSLCRTAAVRGYLPVIVTNQAGIARGRYTEEDFQRLTAWMLDEFRRRGAEVARVYYCPHHPEAGVGTYQASCPSRKPGPDMLLAARDDLGLDLKGSLLLGDKQTDIEAGRRAGIGRLVLLDPLGDKASVAPDVIPVATLADVEELLGADT